MFLPPRPWIAIVLGLVLAWPAQAAPAVREEFEGPETSWKPAGADGQYRVTAHTRTNTVSHGGRGCEQIQTIGNGGTYIYLSHDVGPAPIIGELALGVWIKSDRAGLQILARAVLPRSKNPATGQPLTMLLAGSGYTQVGSWQELRLENVPQQFERQLRVLRAEHGPSVDGHEAFIDRVVLNVYGGPGTTTTWIDDLVLTGFVGTPHPLAAPPATSPAANPFAQRLPSTDRTLPDESSRPGAARLSGAGLTVGDQPYFPRLLEYRGEPLALVKQLGFNGIWMPTAPSGELLGEAAAAGLRIVAPPPSIRQLEALPADGGGIDNQFDPVLVWDLGGALTAKELAVNKRWSQLVRSHDSRARPLICSADCDLWSYSRNVDLLWISRSPLGSSLGLTPYLAWLRERPQWARGGTPPWTMIQTQPSERLVEQANLLSGGKAPQIGWQDEQFRLLVFSALAAGARGICFQSSTPLSATDAATHRRALLLELVNLEIDVIEPWCAGGSFVTSASGDDSNMGAAVMQTDRARLVLPLPNGSFNQFALPLPVAPPTVDPFKKKNSMKTIRQQLHSAPPPGSQFSHIPGVPESNQAYELSLVAFRAVTQKRVAGGTRLLLSDENRNSLFVLTQDPTVVGNLTRRVGRVRSRAAELTRQLTTLHLARVDEAYARLAAKGHAPEETNGWLTTARGLVQQAEAQVAAHNDPQVYYLARRGDQLLRHVERACWDLTLRPVVAPLGNALGTNFDTLPEYWQFMGDMATATRGPNLLPAADFEDLGAALSSGWRYFQHPPSADRQHPEAGLTTAVTVATDPVHGGKQSLRLEVAPADPKEPPAQIETAPMWLTTAPVQVEAGRIVLVHGWVNIPKRIAGSVDGLLIVDSLGGEPLAERIMQTKDWHEFSLYRAAPQSGPMTVTFALSGLGEAYLDDITIQMIDRPAAAPATMPAGTTMQAAPPAAARPTGPQMDAQQNARQQSGGSTTIRPHVGPMQIGTMFQKSF